MSTHSLTKVFDEYNINMLTMYTHYDGYIEGYGIKLLEFLKTKKLVALRWLPCRRHNLANGMGCLAAQIVSHFKREPGDYYLYSPKEGNYEQYEYHIYGRDSEIFMKIIISGKVEVDCNVNQVESELKLKALLL